MTKLSKISLVLSLLIMIIFFTTQSLVVFHFINYVDEIGYFGYACILAFLPFFIVAVLEYFKKNKMGRKQANYIKKLNETLISQSNNPLFYEGNTTEGAKVLTKEVTNTIDVDRCSIWLYNQDKSSIVCEQLYVKSEDKWHQGDKLNKKDYQSYFLTLLINPIIIANDAENHTATSCFTETYLKPLGIKSMLDVPVVYRGETVGVICIESLTLREWDKSEVDFAQLLSSLYTFAYSVKEGNDINRRNQETEKFINEASIISVADNRGKITYVNSKFEDVSGWSLEEVKGKDHNIVNSGVQPDGYWGEMYRIVMGGGIWNDVVTNKTKNGEIYYVDTYIRAIFDINGKLEGFSSIRQDVTDIVKKTKELEKKNTYLEHAAKILRHDMHSGINTYIPRGLKSLERRLSEEIIHDLKIESPLKMIREGLKHTQKVYRGVYEFTNLVKKDTVMEKDTHNLKEIIESYLTSTAYKGQVMIEDLPTIDVNESLFCTAIDNLIRNGLKYNDSDSKIVKIYMENDQLIIQDNGRGMDQEDFERLSKPYTRKEGQKESGTGLGLNICIAILNEHEFNISCEKNEIGTKIKIKIKKEKND
jgi:PAS domain S-box-containing protein